MMSGQFKITAFIMTWLMVILAGLLAGGCVFGQPKTVTVPIVHKPLESKLTFAIPNDCRAPGAQGWPKFANRPEIRILMDTVIEAKQRMGKNEARRRSCECQLIGSFGTNDEKSKAPTYCDGILQRQDAAKALT